MSLMRQVTLDQEGRCCACLGRMRVGAPGDRLWVRETWYDDNALRHTETKPTAPDDFIYYRADGEAGEQFEQLDPPNIRLWRPSIFMPRWASRITLEVTGVRVERLQEITEADAQAEGFPLPGPQPTRIRVTDIDGSVSESRGLAVHMTARGAFCSLWDGINGKRAPWASNPWVWVVEFGRLP